MASCPASPGLPKSLAVGGPARLTLRSRVLSCAAHKRRLVDVLQSLCSSVIPVKAAWHVQVTSCYIEELRPHWQPGFDLMAMTSHFYFCDVDPDLRAPQMEDYEKANGMRPLWVDLDEAIAHNRGVMQRREVSMGLSIQRETYLLVELASDLAKAA